MQIIKIIDAADFEQSVILDNKTFYLRCRYNIRDQNWYLSVHNKDLVPLFLNKKILISFSDMFKSVSEKERPKGYNVTSYNTVQEMKLF